MHQWGVGAGLAVSSSSAAPAPARVVWPCSHDDSTALEPEPEPAASLACAAWGSLASSGPPLKSWTHLRAARPGEEGTANKGRVTRQQAGGQQPSGASSAKPP